MHGEAFRRELERLEDDAVSSKMAIMCAETLWWRCHRRLIADALTVHGHQVLHIMAAGEEVPHALTPGLRVEAGRPVYDQAPDGPPFAGGQSAFVRDENLSRGQQVLLGDGTGAFGTPTYVTHAGHSARDVAAADLDEDGHLDLAVANDGAGPAVIHFGDAAGAFGPATTLALGVAQRAVLVSDVNGDGATDVVLVTDGELVSIFHGTGGGALGAATTFAVGDGRAVQVGDVNRDGRPDLVVALATGTVAVLLGH